MSHRRAFATLAFVGSLLAALPARAQEQGPDMDEVKQKVLEIERLMKGAEQALASSTDTRSAAEKSAEAARKILDDKSMRETGKSAADLRKEAEGGSKEASDTLERLTKAANAEAAEASKKIGEVLNGGASGSGGAGSGIRELMKKVKGEGEGAAMGIKWLLEQTKSSSSSSGGGGGGGGPKDQPKDDPKKPEDKPDDKKPPPDGKKPPSDKEPPRDPQFEQWLAELPPQVRKAYETEDWDSIPPKWRDLLRAWTKKMADDLEKERR